VFPKRPRSKIHLTWSEKVPERSGQTDASGCLRKQFIARSYGDPVLERWRPGGSVLATKGQGSQAYLSLPPHCEGVSYSEAKQLGPHQELRIREDERDGTGIGESR